MSYWLSPACALRYAKMHIIVIVAEMAPNVMYGYSICLVKFWKVVFKRMAAFAIATVVSMHRAVSVDENSNCFTVTFSTSTWSAPRLKSSFRVLFIWERK